MNSDEVLQYIIDLPHYPTLDEISTHFVDLENPSIEDIIHDLLSESSIIIDDNVVIVTAVTNEKQRKLIKESILIKTRV